LSQENAVDNSLIVAHRLRIIRALLGRVTGPRQSDNSETRMVTIRLTRRGARNQPFYHVVVTDSRKRQGGLSLEHVGYFNPIARRSEPKLKLDLPRIDYWVSKGAQQSDRVRNLVASYRKQATA
jgi:small subunit ribosomal protein S16